MPGKNGLLESMILAIPWEERASRIEAGEKEARSLREQALRLEAQARGLDGLVEMLKKYSGEDYAPERPAGGDNEINN